MPTLLQGRRRIWAAALLASSLSLTGTPAAFAADEGAEPEPTPTNSAMDAPLFYQLLMGEMELRNGQPGTAYQVLLDAARRTRDEALFQRVVNIAMQARAGDQALAAANAWRDVVPTSLEAQQTVVQLLALLNRPTEVAGPLRSLLDMTPESQRAGLLASLPNMFQRSPEPKLVAESLNPVLKIAAQQPSTRIVSLIVQARLALAAGDSAQALALTQTIVTEAPQADDALQLALDLLPQQPDAEKIISARLQAEPDNHLLRLAYGRALARAQRMVEAAREFKLVTVKSPSTPLAWLALGSLELDMRHPEAAESALREFMKRIDAIAAAAPKPMPAASAAQDASQPNAQADDDDGDEEPAAVAASTVSDATQELRQQGWLLLAQAAEMRGDLKAAEGLLAKVDSPQRKLELTFRRASLMQRQGKLSQARELIWALPENSADEARAKVMAESQLLRDARDWKEAYAVLERANKRINNDTDLLYEQAMMSEKLGRFDEMETLLKRVTELKPEHYHAYNALGYSLADRNIRLSEARELISKALSFSPTEPYILDSMGWVEFRLGHQNEAVRLLSQAFAARQDAEIAAHLGEVLWVGGEHDDARRVWREGAKRDPKNEALSETLSRLKASP